jgi:hypothetical protein
VTDEYENEPIPGLPELLPEGEELLWQGKPDWKVLAREALHLHALAVYFGVLVLWRIVTSISDGRSAAETATSALWLVLLSLGAIAVLGGIAWQMARTTIYSITSRRIVMRFGIALPMTLNLPFKSIESAALKRNRDGSGDIPLALSGKDRLAYLVIWPHVRPWMVRNPQPMLRAVPNAEVVADLAARALAIATAGSAQQVIGAGGENPEATGKPGQMQTAAA